MENAVDAKSDEKIVLARFYVDIGCSVLNCLRDEKVYEPHDGRTVVGSVIFNSPSIVAVDFFEFRTDGVHFLVGAEILIDGQQDVFAG
jgi:hypothetical protein